MSVAKAIDKIDKVITVINEYKNKIEALMNKYIKKINKLIEDLETTVNNIKNKGIAWAQPRIQRLNKKIQKYLDALNSKIQRIISQITIWYNTTINNIKTAVVKGILTKVGIDATPAAIDAIAATIPHPSIDSIISIPEIEFQLPDLSNIQSSDIKIPRIPEI
jgi:FtsZ-binding cell division protein ZapB